MVTSSLNVEANQSQECEMTLKAVLEVRKVLFWLCDCGKWGGCRGVMILVNYGQSFVKAHCSTHISAGETAGWRSRPCDDVISEAKVLQFV